MPESNMREILVSMPRIPKFPIPDKPQLKEMLIEQILVFQSRYVFQGTQHTKESLELKPYSYLERLCNMQLLGIATSMARDTHINK